MQISNDYIDDLIVRSQLYEFNLIIKKLNREKRILRESGYSELSIHENFANVMGSYLGNMGLDFAGDAVSGFQNSITEYLIDSLFSLFGLEAKTTVGEFFLELLKEFIENVIIMNPTHIAKYFGDDSCKYISKDLIQVLGESGGDILLRIIVKKISDPSYREELLGEEGGSGFESEMIGSLVNALNDSVIFAGLSKVFKEMFQTQILERLEKYVEQTICESDLSLSDQFAGYFGFGQEEKNVQKDEDANIDAES